MSETTDLHGMTLYLGDCLDILREMPDNSIDALVTDPPAGIGFMGKEWDHDKGGRDAWVSWLSGVMRECLRVLKPGAHALVWALPRTSHWTGWALEEAGFEVRDRIAHLFGSGFPKSLDVSKAIDKINGEVGRLLKFTAWMRTTGLTATQINLATDTFMGSHYLTDKSQPAIPTRELWAKLRPLCGHIPAWVDELVERIEAEREIIGQKTAGLGSGKTYAFQDANTEAAKLVDITAPATPAAVQWQGWGTALKPACEDWWLCRKPLEGTVAANVLEWGTGAINIDATRIPTNGDIQPRRADINPTAGWRVSSHKRTECAPPPGRFPANVTHDGSEEVLAGFPMTNGTAYKGPTARLRNGFKLNPNGNTGPSNAPDNYGDSGSAARFFYCAKASRQDREEGCEGLEEVLHQSGMGGAMPVDDNGNDRDRFKTISRNHHPTVKPTPLMRWLCRLITPPGGTVLDPFMGSGSTGKACALEGFGFIGIELDPEYFEIAKRRIEAVQHQPQMVMEL